MKKLVSIICVLIVVMAFFGCKGGLYMEDFKDVQWTCNELEMKFTYTTDNEEMAFGTLTKDNESNEIVCLFTLSKTIEIFDKEQFEARSGDEVCEPLLVGGYTIKDDVATVKILKDNFFNGEYLDKEIHLTKTPIE